MSPKRTRRSAADACFTAASADGHRASPRSTASTSSRSATPAIRGSPSVRHASRGSRPDPRLFFWLTTSTGVEYRTLAGAILAPVEEALDARAHESAARRAGVHPRLLDAPRRAADG